MVGRIWRGWIRTEDTAAYTQYIHETGIAAYKSTPGNVGAWMLTRDEGDRTEVITLSFWESLDSIRGFAGDEIDRAVFYPEDDRFLVERDTQVTHWQIS